MIPKFHPAVFLGAVVLLCAAWLWARPPVSAIETVARRTPRPALVEPASIELDTGILERYVGKYEGRGGFTVDLSMNDGKLLVRSAVAVPFELRATSETEFFLKARDPFAPLPGVTVEFDVTRDGTVRGFAANTELGVIEVKRVR